MNNKNIKNILKIVTVFLSLILFYRISIFLVNANNSIKSENKNSSNYKSILVSDISKSGVAITTNIGTKYKKSSTINSAIYEEYFSIEEIKKNKKMAQDNLISNNLIAIKEYQALLRTDFKAYLNNSTDRKKTFEAIYGQLSVRLNNGINTVKILAKQRELLTAEMDSIDNKLKSIKQKITVDYKKADGGAISKDIEEYLLLKNDYTFVRTYVVFINSFLNYYKVLNEYNSKLLNIFNSNKDAIIKGSYVVLPSGGTEILKDYGLLYTEDEYKAKLQEEEKK
ncbi:hypothetical protein BLD25_03760 [Candidatus Gracilibacteria bacterium GN02-872]|nr:hypothetical protein BLD25_03760 [Candidatus Gracilibacteria bacterium GN02-872]